MLTKCPPLPLLLPLLLTCLTQDSGTVQSPKSDPHRRSRRHVWYAGFNQRDDWRLLPVGRPLRLLCQTEGVADVDWLVTNQRQRRLLRVLPAGGSVAVVAGLRLRRRDGGDAETASPALLAQPVARLPRPLRLACRQRQAATNLSMTSAWLTVWDRRTEAERLNERIWRLECVRSLVIGQTRAVVYRCRGLPTRLLEDSAMSACSNSVAGFAPSTSCLRTNSTPVGEFFANAFNDIVSVGWIADNSSSDEAKRLEASASAGRMRLLLTGSLAGLPLRVVASASTVAEDTGLTATVDSVAVAVDEIKRTLPCPFLCLVDSCRLPEWRFVPLDGDNAKSATRRTRRTVGSLTLLPHAAEGAWACGDRRPRFRVGPGVRLCRRAPRQLLLPPASVNWTLTFSCASCGVLNNSVASLSLHSNRWAPPGVWRRRGASSVELKFESAGKEFDEQPSNSVCLLRCSLEAPDASGVVQSTRVRQLPAPPAAPPSTLCSSNPCRLAAGAEASCQLDAAYAQNLRRLGVIILYAIVVADSALATDEFLSTSGRLKTKSTVNASCTVLLLRASVADSPSTLQPKLKLPIEVERRLRRLLGVRRKRLLAALTPKTLEPWRSTSRKSRSVASAMPKAVVDGGIGAAAPTLVFLSTLGLVLGFRCCRECVLGLWTKQSGSKDSFRIKHEVGTASSDGGVLPITELAIKAKGVSDDTARKSRDTENDKQVEQRCSFVVDNAEMGIKQSHDRERKAGHGSSKRHSRSSSRKHRGKAEKQSQENSKEMKQQSPNRTTKISPEHTVSYSPVHRVKHKPHHRPKSSPERSAKHIVEDTSKTSPNRRPKTSPYQRTKASLHRKIKVSPDYEAQRSPEHPTRSILEDANRVSLHSRKKRSPKQSAHQSPEHEDKRISDHEDKSSSDSKKTQDSDYEDWYSPGQMEKHPETIKRRGHHRRKHGDGSKHRRNSSKKKNQESAGEGGSQSDAARDNYVNAQEMPLKRNQDSLQKRGHSADKGGGQTAPGSEPGFADSRDAVKEKIEDCPQRDDQAGDGQGTSDTQEVNRLQAGTEKLNDCDVSKSPISSFEMKKRSRLTQHWKPIRLCVAPTVQQRMPLTGKDGKAEKDSTLSSSILLEIGTWMPSSSGDSVGRGHERNTRRRRHRRHSWHHRRQHRVVVRRHKRHESVKDTGTHLPQLQHPPGAEKVTDGPPTNSALDHKVIDNSVTVAKQPKATPLSGHNAAVTKQPIVVTATVNQLSPSHSSTAESLDNPTAASVSCQRNSATWQQVSICSRHSQRLAISTARIHPSDLLEDFELTTASGASESTMTEEQVFLRQMVERALKRMH